MKKALKIFKKAPYPALVTIISFILFIGLYLLFTLTVVNPYYIKGLIFIIPFLCFGIVTFYTAADKLSISASTIITSLLIFALGIGMSIVFIFMSINAALTTTVDINRYERVLKVTGYPNNPLTRCFPDKIPADAQNISFHYNPAFLQGGEQFDLKYTSDSVSINKYVKALSQGAKWIGKSNDSNAENNGINTADFYDAGYDELPEDFTIYLIEGKPYKQNNWNHGKISLIAISTQRNEIIFHAEDW